GRLRGVAVPGRRARPAPRRLDEREGEVAGARAAGDADETVRRPRLEVRGEDVCRQRPRRSRRARRPGLDAGRQHQGRDEQELGAIAGFTIYFGLPVGRLQGLGDRTRAFLSVLAAGILLFIFWDVLDAAHGILESGLLMAKDGHGWGTFAARGVMAAAGILAGGLGLAWIEHQLLRRRTPAPMAGGSADAAALGAAVP